MSEPARSLPPRSEPAVAHPALDAAGASHQGRVRTSNEDRFHVDAERGIFLVADGVGGHAAGEVAAEIAVDVIVKRLERPMWTARQRVREAIALANNEIFRQSEASPEHAGMTCVLTLALLHGRQLTIGHVGDSRLYALTRQGIRKLTHDHSPIGEREDANELSEAEAMRHPRRNEVFRDVGSAFHEPEDEDFIEVIETTFEEDSAILLCSDGLSDMVPSTTIERIARQHAGDPRAVAEALIEAANEAGGKDNVTVVYVEGPEFGEAREAETTRVPRLDEDDRREDAVSGGALSAIVASRPTWLTIGVLLGLLLGFALTTYNPLDRPFPIGGGRTLVVGGTAAGNYPSMAAAMSAAVARDVVQIEPGEYAEGVTLKDGVNLVARVPGTVTFVAPPANPAWTSITVGGRGGNRIEGIRILGRPNAPIGIGLQLAGHNLVVDDVTIEGTVGVGMDIVSDGAILVRSSRLSNVTGVPMRLGELARPQIRQNWFSTSAPANRSAAVQTASTASPEFVANVFTGFQEPIDGSVSLQFLQQNYVVRGTGNGR